MMRGAKVDAGGPAETVGLGGLRLTHETSGAREYVPFGSSPEYENSQARRSSVAANENLASSAPKVVRASQQSSNWYETQAVEPNPGNYQHEYLVRPAPVADEVTAKVEKPFKFFCDNCDREIGTDEPRIHCNDCEDYDSCSFCHLSGRMSGKHTSAHRFQIIKPSEQPGSKLQDKSTRSKSDQQARRTDGQNSNPTMATSPQSAIPHKPVQSSQSLSAGKSTTASGIREEQWGWLGRIKNGKKEISPQAKNLFNAIFDYIDNMYEPFGAGHLTAKKLMHARTFWLPPKAKKWWFDNAREAELEREDPRYLHYQSMLEDLLEEMDIDTGPSKYDRVDTSRSSRSSWNGWQIAQVKREEFYKLCTEHMFAFPNISWRETAAMIKAIPDAYKTLLPSGYPAETCFPARDHATDWRLTNLRGKYPTWSFLIYSTDARNSKASVLFKQRADKLVLPPGVIYRWYCPSSPRKGNRDNERSSAEATG
ncbi:hypothetical protein Dda_2161 [Drechslerella dactyloides]|uniref:ZZ-type domain-containing protein n=1 Tax=Drechslerella dactyloides TaxID=74499 RepID=A0AAD6J305_DREDA|nr:hypothetical protein Dda_2161 [Drechslerella dactyloides]